MESLVNYYESDEEEIDNKSDKMEHAQGRSSEDARVAVGDSDNYDNVGMDMSDDESNQEVVSSRVEKCSQKNEKRSEKKEECNIGSSNDRKIRHDHEKTPNYESGKDTEKGISAKHRNGSDYRSQPTSQKSHSPETTRDRHDVSKNRDRRRSPDRSRHERKRSRSRSRSKHEKDRRYDSRRRRSSSRDCSSRRSSNDRDSRRSSKERSNREQASSYHNRSRTPNHRRQSPKSLSPTRAKPTRHERNSTKLAALDKLGIEIKTPDCEYVTPKTLLNRTIQEKADEEKNPTGIELPKYYNPAAMNPARYAQQIQKRRLLWGNKNTEVTASTSQTPQPTSTGDKTKLWKGTQFAHDQDGKAVAKFKRLMGIKDNDGPPAKTLPTTDTLKKQEELFHTMEAQYEVARAVTHTMRGVGLGFGAFGHR